MSSMLSIAVVGMGRMGRRHAVNLLTSVPRAQLVAVCDVQRISDDWLDAAVFDRSKIGIYQDFGEMLKHPGLEAVIIASSTAHHASQIVAAVKAGKHVLCEKPISVDVAEAELVLSVVREHAHAKVMIGHSRRFDESYLDAKEKAAAIGDVHMVSSRTVDLFDEKGFFVAFSQLSGGLFVDCGIHDVDLALWYMNNPKPLRVYATGVCALYPELEKHGDCDDGYAIVEFEGRKRAVVYLSRNHRAGHDCQTEIVGTQGTLRVNSIGRQNRVEIADAHGLRSLMHQDYYARFKDAFLSELQQFVSCVMDDKPVPVTVEDGVAALRICVAMRKSFTEKRIVEIA